MTGSRVHSKVVDLLSLAPKPETKKIKGKCPQHGDYESFKCKVNGTWQGGNCPQCQEAAKTGFEPVPYQHIEAVIPKRFAGCTFESFQSDGHKEQQYAFKVTKKYAEEFNGRLESGGGLVLHGKCGTGKTHLSCAIANHIIKNRMGTVSMAKVYDVVADVKDTWSNSFASESEVIRNYTKPDLLIIDEVGVQFGSEAETLILFRILNKRYEDVKPTILVSNLNYQELVECLGERVMDRMNEGGGARIAFTWDSFRK